MRQRFAATLLLLLLAAGLQFQTGRIAGLWINFIFSLAITAALSLDLPEFLFLLFLSVFILNWQPVLGTETATVSILPAAVFLSKKFLPWQGWLNNLLFIFLGVLLLYLIVSPSYFFGNPEIFFKDAFASVIFGAVSFPVINKYRLA